MATSFKLGQGQSPLSKVRGLITYLQSGSVYIFRQPVAPPGGDNEGFIGVNLKGSRGSKALSDFRDTVTRRLGYFNIQAWVIMLTLYLVLCWEKKER